MAADDQAVELLLRFARSAHEAGGYPANELEPRIVELARALGLSSVQASATPTSVELTVGSIPHQHVYSLRVQPHPVDLHAIDRLDAIVAAVAAGRLDCRGALEEIDELGRHPLRRPDWLLALTSGVVAAALAPILGGGWRESVGAAMVGLAVGVLTRVVLRSERARTLATPLGAFLASFLACLLAVEGFDIAVTNVTLAALVAFLPGMSMAIGMRELATHHLQAGLANSANALVQLVGLAFGVGVGRSMATSWLGTIPVNIPDPFPHGVDIAAAAVVGLAFVVTLRAPARDAIWTCSAAVLAIVANLVATRFLGGIAGVFVAALVVGLAGNVVARRLHRSPLPFIVPGSLMLVPGGIGYQSAASLLADQTLTGIDTAFDAIVILLAIAYGLVASTVLMPDRPAASPGREGSWSGQPVEAP
ncbi:MAG: threonine/serine ThrE exporter family protein [Candidatus Polarisedimenticolia bacterium]